MIRKPVFFILLFTFSAFNLWSQKFQESGKISPLLFHMLQEFHYAPKERNEHLSKQIFENLVKTVDPYGLLFTQKTLVQLRPLCDSLCSENPAIISDFLSRFSGDYQRQLIVCDSLVEHKFRLNFDFKNVDSLKLAMEKITDFPKEKKDLETRYEKWVKYMIIRTLLYDVADSTGKIPASIPDSLFAPGSALMKKIQIREKRRISQLRNCSGGIENFVLNSFLNSITACYDPHTAYFSTPDKEQFESSLSRENYAFGFQLGNNLRDEVIISKILPGSPLWSSGKLESGDVLLKIKVPDQEETDLTFASIAEVDQIFAMLKDNSVDLTVRKKDGSVATVEMMKGRFDSRENQTVGLILDDQIKVGYIWFSSFYTSMSQYGNVGCSIDLLKEMIKLKESGIKGLIIDLRNNPGGSEGEALEIASYFVGNGALALETNQTRVEHVLQNANGTQWYNDPVVLLTNRNSASASELLSAILQDYKRGIVVGSNTYGKATGQYVLPVGRKMASINPYSRPSAGDQTGFVKLTTSKLFRITGKSYQKTGVTPDIVLPDIYENYAPTEADNPSALPNDSIPMTKKFSPEQTLPYDSLAHFHDKRMKSDSSFGRVSAMNRNLKKLVNAPKETLSLTQYRAEVEQINHLVREFEKIQDSPRSAFKVENTAFKMKEMEKDSIDAEFNRKLIDAVQKDIYVDEARSVLIDLIRLSGK